LRVTLGFLEKLTLRPDDVQPADVAPLRAAGLSDQAIEDAIHVCALFNVIDRVADSLDFDIPSAKSLRRSATMLLRVGYRLI
jgi:alkylhydroperoxidase family enzyme